MFKLSDNGISVIVDTTVAVMLTSAANTAATTTAYCGQLWQAAHWRLISTTVLSSLASINSSKGDVRSFSLPATSHYV